MKKIHHFISGAILSILPFSVAHATEREIINDQLFSLIINDSTGYISCDGPPHYWSFIDEDGQVIGESSSDDLETSMDEEMEFVAKYFPEGECYKEIQAQMTNPVQILPNETVKDFGINIFNFSSCGISKTASGQNCLILESIYMIIHADQAYILQDTRIFMLLPSSLFSWNGGQTNNNPPQTQSQTKIYPNPTNGQFNIELSEGGATSVKIYNILGQLVNVGYNGPPITNFHFTFPKELPTGRYFAALEADGQTIVKSIVYCK